jgi:hypothetical protein
VRWSSLRKLLLPGWALSLRHFRQRCSAGKSAVLVETGVDEDDIEPDGNERATTWNASAIPLKTRATSSDRDQVAAKLRSCLQNMAAAGLTVTYGGLAGLLGLSPPNTIHQITVALERLMEEDAEASRPFLAALVLSKARGDLPAAGFFGCAHRLGRFTGDANGVEARSFHATELNAAQKFWVGRTPAARTSNDAAALSDDARAPLRECLQPDGLAKWHCSDR